MNFKNKDRYDVYDLKEIISILRSPEGCPWDQKQTHESIRRNFLEEAYEVAEAIDEKDPQHLCEELGDVLMQVLFHADIESDAGRFELDDVADMTVRKLITRHPHVFGNVIVSGSDDVLKNWDDIKRIEKNQETITSSLNSVARSLPGLWRAEKIQKRAAKSQEWSDINSSVNRLEEELSKLSDVISKGAGIEELLGNIIFLTVNVARNMGIDPELAVSRACDKFISQFELMEKSGEFSYTHVH